MIVVGYVGRSVECDCGKFDGVPAGGCREIRSEIERCLCFDEKRMLC